MRRVAEEETYKKEVIGGDVGPGYAGLMTDNGRHDGRWVIREKVTHPSRVTMASLVYFSVLRYDNVQ